MFRIDDILAAVILALCMMRRLEAIGAQKERNPHVSAAAFDRWRTLALKSYELGAGVCLAKVALSVLWFMAAPPVPWLQIGGLLIFITWVVALVVAWRRATEADAMRRDLGIMTRNS